MTTPPFPLRWLFIDMDSFFASVEQAEDPALQGRPVAVLPTDCDTTCCIAASYEAKACGVRTGTLVREAKERCPDITFIVARHGRYMDAHNAVRDTVHDCLPVSHVLSIDEMACELMRNEAAPEIALKIGRTIQRTIRERLSPALGCSIGISSNLFLAKTACKLHKPRGLCVLQGDELPQALSHLKLTDLTGIGIGRSRQLQNHGIHHITQLCLASRAKLTEAFGSTVLGEYWQSALRGIHTPVAATHRRSLSHQRVLAPEQRSRRHAEAISLALLHKAWQRFHPMSLAASSLLLNARLMNGRQWRRRRIHIPMVPARYDWLSLQEHLQLAWKQMPDLSCQQIGIELTDFKPRQMSLFPEQQKRERLSGALFDIQKKHGGQALFSGGTCTDRGDAPPPPKDCVAFTHGLK